MDIDVDGHKVSAQPGERLLDALRKEGWEIPSPCYHPTLGPLQTCDACWVEVDGRLVRSCSLELQSAVRVRTTTDAAQQAREEAVQRLVGKHELYCTVCDNNDGSCEVKRATELVQLRHQKVPFEKKSEQVDDSNPFYRYDPNQCILCSRCVEACQNVQVTETLSIDWSSSNPMVRWDGGSPAGESSCVSCGHCVTVCPCNALMEKSALGHEGNITGLPNPVHRTSIRAVKSVEPVTTFKPLFVISDLDRRIRHLRNSVTKTVCTYCGVGCAFDVHHRKGRIHRIQPTERAPANGISTCVKGKFGWSYIDSEDRLTQPLVKNDQGTQEASTWDHAFEEIVSRLRKIVQKHGPNSVGFISSSKITNEENYLMQKLARSVFGTNNIDNCARYCQSPASKGLTRTVGIGADSGTMDHIDQADLVFVMGSNTTVSHPVLASRIKRRKKRGEMELVVADLRKHDLAQWADTFLRPTMGSDVFLLNAMAKVIVDEGLEDRRFIESRVHGFDGYRDGLAAFDLAQAEDVTGIPANEIRREARRFARAERVCGLWAMGLTQHVDGTDACTAFANLLLLTGNFGRPGTGAYPLRGHNNVQGACDFGALYDHLPGYQSVSDDEARRRYETAWGGESIPSEPGLNNTTMIEAALEGRLKALFVVGEELRLVDAHTERTELALSNLEFLVVQDIFPTTTAKMADVVLAACPSFEKTGTFVNTERRIQKLNSIRPPEHQCREDWRITTELARRLGHDWGYTSPSEIMDEIAGLTPVFAGVRYDRLEGFSSLVWPVAEDGTDTPLLYEESFAFPDGKARFHPVEWRAQSELPDGEYDLVLDNGRVLEHFHEGVMTMRVDGIREISSEATLELSPGVAEKKGVAEGDVVRVHSRRGVLEVPALISSELSDQVAYLALHGRRSGTGANMLTSGAKDPDTDTPAYKEVAVRVVRTPERNPRVVKSGHPRYGKPTPLPPHGASRGSGDP